MLTHLYDRLMLNRAALLACGYDSASRDPPGAYIERRPDGAPTGLIVANPDPAVIYATLAKAPKLPPVIRSPRRGSSCASSTASASPASSMPPGGSQNFSDDYAIIQRLADGDQLTIQIAYNLLPQRRVVVGHGTTRVLPEEMARIGCERALVLATTCTFGQANAMSSSLLISSPARRTKRWRISNALPPNLTRRSPSRRTC